MNKRGQVYILAAIILSIAIFVLAKKVNIAQQETLKDDFEKLSNNYERESIRFINSLLLTEQDNIQDSFLNFSFLFTSYSKTQNPDFGLIYIFDYKDNLQIGNFLSHDIIVDNGTTASELYIIPGCFESIPAVIQFQGLSFSSKILNKEVIKCSKIFPSINEVWVQIDSFWYPIKISRNKPQIVIVSKEEAQEQRKVFVGGEEDNYVKEDTQKPQSISDLCSVIVVNDFYKSYCKQQDGGYVIKNCELITTRSLCDNEDNCKWKGSWKEGECIEKT